MSGFHEEGKPDNVVFVWRDWCILGLGGPRSDCGAGDTASDSGAGLFVFISETTNLSSHQKGDFPCHLSLAPCSLLGTYFI